MIRNILPKSLRNLRHLLYAWWGAVKYGHPSEKLYVIGVTGTSGKSSAIYFLRQILEYAGFSVGALSTIEFAIAGDIKLNDKKMTMLGKTAIQKYLREMVKKSCEIAIVESTSEGVLQYRHRGINYDLFVLTNLYPEHIESHGSFEGYKAAKLKLFRYMGRSRFKSGADFVSEKMRKKFSLGTIRKIAVVNGNSEYASEFLVSGHHKIIFGLASLPSPVEGIRDGDRFAITESSNNAEGISFTVQGKTFQAPIYGAHQVMNIVAAITVARSLGIDWETIQRAVKELKSPPGRVEFIPEAGRFGFCVIVDYAFEPVALEGLYKVVALFNPKRVIHVGGATGGGRDKARRAPIGRLVGEKADIVIVTNEDPYDEDPMEIIKTVSRGAQMVGKKLNVDLFEILDRGEAIKKALALAQAGDLVLVAGKGSEQAMCMAGGRMIAWDDRKVVRQALTQRPSR